MVSLQGLTTHRWLGAALRILFILFSTSALCLVVINLTWGHILEKEVILRVVFCLGVVSIVGLFSKLQDRLPTLKEHYKRKAYVKQVLVASLVAGTILSICVAYPMEDDNVAGPKSVPRIASYVYTLGTLMLIVNFVLLLWNYLRYGADTLPTSNAV